MADRIKVLDNPLLKEGVIGRSHRMCQICNKKRTNAHMAYHLMSEHGLTPQQYVLHLLGLTELPGCAICGKDLSDRFLSISRGFPDTCSQKCALSKPSRVEALSDMMKKRFEDPEYLKLHSEWSSRTMSAMNKGEIHPHFKENKNAVVWGENGDVNRKAASEAIKKYRETFKYGLVVALGRFSGDSPVNLYVFRAGDYIKIGVSRRLGSRLSMFSYLGPTELIRTISLPKHEACLSEQTILRLTEEYNPRVEIGLWGESELRKPVCLDYVHSLFDEVEQNGVISRGFENEGVS